MEQLFTGFNTANAAAWKARLEKDLKGVTFDQLSVTDRNGITIHPFYTNEDITEAKAAVTTEPDWSICAQIMVTDAKTANAQALHELDHGASGLCFVIHKMVDPATLLLNIEMPYIHSSFRLNSETAAFSIALQNYLREQGADLATMDCFIIHDVIEAQLRSGEKQEGENTLAQQIAVDATLFLNAGANSAYELACALAQMNEYIILHQDNNTLNAVKKVYVSLATDTSFFEQIAKLRAFRKLTKIVFNEYGFSPELHLHIETANTYRSPFDSYSNLLRDTIAGMAAVIGGCDSLYIHLFDETLQEPTDFSLRMSRNQQLIFKEESYLNKVADAAAGSYYIETLTEQIAEQAWSLFKETEQNGGLISSFDKGIIQAEIKKQAAQLIQEYKDGKRVLIGVNKFINAKDEPKSITAKHITGKGLQPLLLSAEII